MSRSELLSQLSKLRYCVLWPGYWKDIGFTERPIWVNGIGYGYFSDDEPCAFFEMVNLSSSFLDEVKRKLADGTITANDLRGSSLDQWRFVYNKFVDVDSLQLFLDALQNSSVANREAFFCGEHYCGWDFFVTEDELIQAFTKDYDYGALWSGMSDDELSVWLARLHEAQSFELPIHLDIFQDEH